MGKVQSPAEMTWISQCLQLGEARKSSSDTQNPSDFFSWLSIHLYFNVLCSACSQNQSLPLSLTFYTKVDIYGLFFGEPFISRSSGRWWLIPWGFCPKSRTRHFTTVFWHSDHFAIVFRVGASIHLDRIEGIMQIE